MGKASRWFRALLGLKKPDPKPCTDPKPPAKKKWSFGRPHTEKERRGSQHNTVAPSDFDDGESSRHAAAVAAATAAVAEAAVAAAQAAAAVVQLTNSAAGVASCSAALASRNFAGYGTRDEWAAVRIQSHFRAYLARRALQALKGLVKLQALAKGYICRKQFTEYLQQMQAIARAQERARAGRVLNSEVSESSTNSSSLNNYNSPATPEKSENIAKSMKYRHLKTIKRNVSRKSYGSTGSNHRRGLKSNEQPLEQGSFTRIFPMEDEIGDKILEVDTVEPNVLLIPNYRHVSHSNLSDHPPYYYYSGHLRSPNEARSFGPYTYSHDQMDETSYFCTGQNSPIYHLTSSIGGSSKQAGLTPAKSNWPKSYSSGYLDHPNYMANTESSKAKVRSVSAPKQRPTQYDRSSSASRNSAMHELGNNNSSNYNCDYNESRVNGVQRTLALHASFTSKAYPGSGRLDRLGMPV